MRLPWPHRPSQAGHSLVEVLIAGTILVTALLASVRNQISSLALLESSRDTEVATELLRAAMDECFLASNAELADAGGAYAPGVALDLPEALEGQQLVYTLPGYAGGAVPAFLEVQFQLTWTSSSGLPRTQVLNGGKR
jgi:Tfp pilus assembly protein PilV